MFHEAGASLTGWYCWISDDTGASAGTTKPLAVVLVSVLGSTAGAASAGVGTGAATAVEGVGATPGTPAVAFELSMLAVPAVPDAGLGAEAFDDASRVEGDGAPAEGVPTAGASAAGAGTSTVPSADSVADAGAGTDTLPGAGAGTPAVSPQLKMQTGWLRVTPTGHCSPQQQAKQHFVQPQTSSAYNQHSCTENRLQDYIAHTVYSCNHRRMFHRSQTLNRIIALQTTGDNETWRQPGVKIPSAGAGTGAEGEGAGALTPGAGAGTDTLSAAGAGAGTVVERAGAGTGTDTVVPCEGAGTGTAVAGAGTGAVELLTVVNTAGAGTGAVTAAVGEAAAGATAGEVSLRVVVLGAGAGVVELVVDALGAGVDVSEPVDGAGTGTDESAGGGVLAFVELATASLDAFGAAAGGETLLLTAEALRVLLAGGVGGEMTATAGAGSRACRRTCWGLQQCCWGLQQCCWREGGIG